MTKTVDSIGRCVILIDEVEKYLNTGATSGSGDSGTSSRSFGTLLSWLSDRTNPAFIIYTSNNHLALPVELIRKGRFDELFWIDLPNREERLDILNVVVKKFKRDPAKFNLNELADACNQFTGAEIDNAFKDAMFEAFSLNEEVTMKHVIKEFKAVVPQAVINEAAIAKMRETVEGRLRLATDSKAEEYISQQTRKVKA
jgi:SpoVK/Ycf46/Vps4 family AAA+-type ATPase